MIPLFTETGWDGWRASHRAKEKGRLDKTLIVILGDHGLRTRREYPPFHAGTLDDVTFHVPLVLYAPGVVESTVRIPWMTSHIDIAPSVLDLLGIQDRPRPGARQPDVGSGTGRPHHVFLRAGVTSAPTGTSGRNEAVMVRYLYGGVLRAEWNGALRFRATDAINGFGWQGDCTRWMTSP